MNNLIEVRDLSKTFTLHQQQGVVLNVLRGLNFNVAGGECLVLHGRSGAGKEHPAAHALRQLPAGRRQHPPAPRRRLVGTGRRRASRGARRASPDPRLRQPVPAGDPAGGDLDVVMEPALARGWSRDSAELRARSLLARLNIPERLWQLAPGTFPAASSNASTLPAASWSSGRSCCSTSRPRPRRSQPPGSAGADRRSQAAGAALIGIFHDRAAREAVASRYLDMSQELSRQEQAHVV